MESYDAIEPKRWPDVTYLPLCLRKPAGLGTLSPAQYSRSKGRRERFQPLKATPTRKLILLRELIVIPQVQFCIRNLDSSNLTEYKRVK